MQTLKDEFNKDFKKYGDIFIATNDAEKYLKKISNYVLNELNVSNADKNKDGKVTIKEVTQQEVTKDENITDNKIKKSTVEGKDILEALYERQEKLQKQITKLALKISGLSEEEAQLLQDKLANLNTQ